MGDLPNDVIIVVTCTALVSGESDGCFNVRAVGPSGGTVRAMG